MGKALVIIGADFSEYGIQPSLDDIVYEDLSYRDIFETNNYIAITPGFEDGTYGQLTVNSGNPTVTDEDSDTGQYSLYASGTTSQQLLIKNGLNGTYFIAARVKCTDYTSGRIGLSAGQNYGATIDHVNNNFETVSTIHTASNYPGVYIGSMNNANLSGYIDTPVLVFMDIFTQAPSLSTLTQLYENYVEILRNQ